MNSKTPKITSTRASSRAAAASLTHKNEPSDKEASPQVEDGGVASSDHADEPAKDPILAKLRRPKPEVIKPRQFRIPESLFSQVESACDQLGCTYSDFARAAFESLIGKLREEGEIR